MLLKYCSQCFKVELVVGWTVSNLEQVVLIGDLLI